MKILEHTSTHLILKDPASGIWFARFIGSIFLIFGCTTLFVLFKDIVLDIIAGKIWPTLQGLFFISFCIIMGTLVTFFSSINTFYFDKSLGKLIIKYEKLFRTKNVEYPLNSIASVRVETQYSSKGRKYFVELSIAANPQKIRLSDIAFMRLRKAEERADLIRTFLAL